MEVADQQGNQYLVLLCERAPGIRVNSVKCFCASEPHTELDCQRRLADLATAVSGADPVAQPPFEPIEWLSRHRRGRSELAQLMTAQAIDAVGFVPSGDVGARSNGRG
jgi:hypothetical protein